MKIAISTVIACLACVVGCCCGGRSDLTVAGTAEYDRVVKTFRVTQSEAYNIALAYARERKLLIMDKNPLAIIGRSYFFGKPDPFGVRVDWGGVLVNGDTGEVNGVSPAPRAIKRP